MSYYAWKPYVSAGQRRKQAEKAAAKAKKSGASWSAIAPSSRAIAKTFWGKAWCDNLEAYSDHENRLPRGRTYARNGSVIHLQINQGEVQARVMGSSLYQVEVTVKPVPPEQWRAISTDCAGSIDSLVELLQGRLSTAVMQRICTPKTGLFPAPTEMKFSCTCPDWAGMCKHVAAVLYGVGARLDQQPELLFSLRGVDAQNLVSQASAVLPKTAAAPARGKRLDPAMLADVFGIEMDEAETPAKAPVKAPARAARPRKPPATAKAAKTSKAATEPPTKTLAKAPAIAPAIAPARKTPKTKATAAKVPGKKPAASPKVAAAKKPMTVKKPVAAKPVSKKRAA